MNIIEYAVLKKRDLLDSVLLAKKVEGERC